MSSTKNYYETLQIQRNSTQEDIANAFRRLSLKFHPKTHESKHYAINEYYFNQIAEAYEVLSDPFKRGVYDIYGEYGLREGKLDTFGNLKGGYKYAGNAHQIFEKFFGTTNPFALNKDYDRIDDEFGSMFSSAFGGMYEKRSPAIKNVEVDFECTLEELYNGTVKRLVYNHTVINPDGRTTRVREEEKEIELFKGYSEQTVLTFPGLGNEAPAQQNSDLIVRLKEKKHRYFKRKGNDLIYTQKVTLADALNGKTIQLETLDGRKLYVSMDEVITPQTVKVVKNEGMPIYNKDEPLQNLLYDNNKGNLYIKFDVVFPKFIEPEKKEEIIRILQENN